MKPGYYWYQWLDKEEEDVNSVYTLAIIYPDGAMEFFDTFGDKFVSSMYSYCSYSVSNWLEYIGPL